MKYLFSFTRTLVTCFSGLCQSDATTTFAINSMTKAFTGVVFMQLVEEGKITLEDPISNYLENLPETWKNVTIQQVLTHTSGLPNMMDYNAKVIAS